MQDLQDLQILQHLQVLKDLQDLQVFLAHHWVDIRAFFLTATARRAQRVGFFFNIGRVRVGY